MFLALLLSSLPSEVTRPKAARSLSALSLTTVVLDIPFTAFERTFTGTEALTFGELKIREAPCRFRVANCYQIKIGVFADTYISGHETQHPCVWEMNTHLGLQRRVVLLECASFSGDCFNTQDG